MELVTCPICNKRMTNGQVNMHLDNGCESSMSSPLQPVQQLPSSSPPLKRSQPSSQREISSAITKNPLFQPAVKAMSTRLPPPASSFFNSTKKSSNQTSGVKRAFGSIGSDNEDESEVADINQDLKVFKTGLVNNSKHTISTNNNAPRRQNRRNNAIKPMAELIRPNNLEEYIGQQDLVGPQGILRAFIERDTCPSIILWGPSGVRIFFYCYRRLN